jgi:hypothetical protein
MNLVKLEKHGAACSPKNQFRPDGNKRETKNMITRIKAAISFGSIAITALENLP